MSEKIKTQIIKIENMTCTNCENTIERGLSKVPGIKKVVASYTKGMVTVTFDTEVISISQIEKIIEKLDYKVKKNISQKMDTKAGRWDGILNIVGAGVVLLALYLILDRYGFLNVFNAFPIAKEGMGYGVLFVIGLLTSIHCAAMCGGICISQCVSKNETHSHNSRFSAIRPSLLYNLGRVISYTVIGGIVGAIGSAISFSGSLKGIVQISAGVLMVIMGLNMMNLFPGLRKFTPRMPKAFGKIIYGDNNRSRSPLIIGLLNGLMPCGPLQAMQLYALSTGSPLKGAISMFIFSVGTVPLLFGLGALSSFLKKKFTSKMMVISSVLIVILGGFMFSNGMSLSGIGLSVKKETITASSQNTYNIATIENGVQTVTTSLSSGRYEPIMVQKGIPVIWTINAPDGSINGCNGTMIIQEFNLEKEFEVGDNVFEFTPTESGVIPYSCWMGMIRSSITVVDDISNITGEETSTFQQLETDLVPVNVGGCCGELLD